MKLFLGSDILKLFWLHKGCFLLQFSILDHHFWFTFNMQKSVFSIGHVFFLWQADFYKKLTLDMWVTRSSWKYFLQRNPNRWGWYKVKVACRYTPEIYRNIDTKNCHLQKGVIYLFQGPSFWALQPFVFGDVLKINRCGIKSHRGPELQVGKNNIIVRWWLSQTSQKCSWNWIIISPRFNGEKSKKSLKPPS